MGRDYVLDKGVFAMLRRLGREKQLLVLGFVAGGMWLGFAIAFDYWSYDGERSLIPRDGLLEVVTSVLAAGATGMMIAVVFQRAILRSSRKGFFALPLLTLPIALALFSTLIWLARVVLGSNESADWSLHPPSFLGILAIYMMYGLGGIFAPILYGLALATQWAIRRVSV